MRRGEPPHLFISLLVLLVHSLGERTFLLPACSAVLQRVGRPLGQKRWGMEEQLEAGRPYKDGQSSGLAVRGSALTLSLCDSAYVI